MESAVLHQVEIFMETHFTHYFFLVIEPDMYVSLFMAILTYTFNKVICIGTMHTGICCYLLRDYTVLKYWLVKWSEFQKNHILITFNGIWTTLTQHANEWRERPFKLDPSPFSSSGSEGIVQIHHNLLLLCRFIKDEPNKRWRYEVGMICVFSLYAV